MFSKHCSSSSSSSPSRSPFFDKNALDDNSIDAQRNGWQIKTEGLNVPCSIYRPQLPNANMAFIAIFCPVKSETVKLRVHAQDNIEDDIVFFVHHAKGVSTKDCIKDVFSFTTADLFPDSATHVNVIKSAPFKTEEGASYDPRCIGLNEFKSTKNQEHGHHNEIKLSSGWNYCFVRFGVQKPDVESIEFKDTTFETYIKKKSVLKPLTVKVPTLQPRTYCLSLSLLDCEARFKYGVVSPFRNCIFQSEDGLIGDYPNGIMKGFKEVSRDNKLVVVEGEGVVEGRRPSQRWTPAHDRGKTPLPCGFSRNKQFNLYKLYLLLNGNTELIWNKKWPNLLSADSGLSEEMLSMKNQKNSKPMEETPWFEFWRGNSKGNGNLYLKHYFGNRNNARYPFSIEFTDTRGHAADRDNKLLLTKFKYKEKKIQYTLGMRTDFYRRWFCYHLWNIFEIDRKKFQKQRYKTTKYKNTVVKANKKRLKRVRDGVNQRNSKKQKPAFANNRTVYKKTACCSSSDIAGYYDTVPLFTPTGSPVNNSIENLEPLSPKELSSEQWEILLMNDPLPAVDDFSDVDQDALAANVQAQNDHMRNHLAVREDMDDIREMALMKKNGFDWEATNNTEQYPVEDLDSFDFEFMFD